MYTEQQLREAFRAGVLHERSEVEHFITSVPTEDEFIDSLKEAVDNDTAESLETFWAQFNDMCNKGNPMGGNI